MRRLVPMLIVALAACADSAVAPGGDSPDFARIKDAEDSHGGTPFMAVLTPGAEVPGPGDPNPAAQGVVVFTLNSGQEEICFKMSFSGLTVPAGAAHIHNAPAGAAAPVLVGLGAVPSATEGTVARCVFAPREVIKAIRKAPENYYVNLHTFGGTGARPRGAIRGQLTRTEGSDVNHF